MIEIGANDGHQSDHLAELIASTAWRGILVEPQPEAFARLSERYGGLERMTLENVAIAERDGRIPFYEILPPPEGEPPELVGSYDLLGSLSREALLSHGWIAGVERRIVRTEVNGMRFESLCRKHSVGRIDMLLIDTEGHDHEILKQVDFDAHRPRLVAYEHALLSAEQREASGALLRECGYEVMEEYLDTWCLDTTPDDRLTARWRRLTPIAPGISLRDD